MKVILIKDMPEVGRAGTVLKVAPGYARNYLLPRGLALEATEGTLRQLELKRKRADDLAALDRAEATKTAEVLATLDLRFTLKAGEHDQLYGSVTQADIADALAERGVEVDRRKIHLKEHIKKTGTHIIDIRLLGEVTGKVRVIVDAEGLPKEEKAEDEAPADAEAEAPAETDAEVPAEAEAEISAETDAEVPVEAEADDSATAEEPTDAPAEAVSED